MKKPPSTPAVAADADPRLAWLRLGALACGILAALLIVATVTGLSARGVRDWVDGFGAAAPLVFIVVSASLTCALFPGPVLAAASGLLFGTALGFPVSLTAATLGASCAFLISRRVGLGGSSSWPARASSGSAAGSGAAASSPSSTPGSSRACRTRSSTTRPA